MIRKISLIVQCNSLNVINTRVAAIIRHEKQKDMKKNNILQAFSILGHYWG